MSTASAGDTPNDAPAPLAEAHRFDHVRAVRANTGVADRLPHRLGPDGGDVRATGAARAELTWTAVLALLLALRLAHELRFRRNLDASDATLHEWRRSWKVLVLPQASTWAVAVRLFRDLGTPYHRTALMPVIFSLGLALVQLRATQQRL